MIFACSVTITVRGMPRLSDQNGFKLIRAIARVHHNQDPLRPNLVMQQLDGFFRNPQSPQRIREINLCERGLLLIGCPRCIRAA